MRRPAVQECGAWKLFLLACRGCLFVLHEGVGLMTAHTRPAFHEWIRLQLRHLIGVTGVACAQRRLAREVLCGCLAMAHGAFDTVGGMRAGFPLVIHHLMAGGAGIPGWNQPMDDMRGLILLSNGRLGGNRQKEKNEQGGTEHTSADPIHGKILLWTRAQYQNGDACRSVILITSHRNAIFAPAARSARFEQAVPRSSRCLR
jgi:hypothetical protein